VILNILSKIIKPSWICSKNSKFIARSIDGFISDKFVTLENFYFLICENWTLDITEYFCVELIWWQKYVLATEYPPTTLIIYLL